MHTVIKSKNEDTVSGLIVFERAHHGDVKFAIENRLCTILKDKNCD